jgi:hypothetical protein
MPKPQSKTEKKLDNRLRLALTDVCEQTLGNTLGFEWLTHQANYTNFPATLLVTCVFDTEAHRQQAEASGETAKLQRLIQVKLLAIGVKFKNIGQQVLFDSEEACELEHAGDWVRRLASRAQRTAARNYPQ